MYRCSNCGETMSYPHDRCPGCGVLLSGVRCEGCGYTDAKSAFVSNNHRCPKCGSVVYTGGGGGDSSSGDGGCFVATAVFGDYDCEEVVKLRYFRDFYLLRSRIGDKFVSLYYKNGPKWAASINDKPFVKNIIRGVLRLFCRIL